MIFMLGWILCPAALLLAAALCFHPDWRARWEPKILALSAAAGAIIGVGCAMVSLPLVVDPASGTVLFISDTWTQSQWIWGLGAAGAIGAGTMSALTTGLPPFKSGLGGPDPP